MKQTIINPCRLSGTVKVPPSKSLAHRAIICAALSKGISKISNIDYSDDINATIEGMKALGALITEEDGNLIIDGRNTFCRTNCIINCNESGSTLRFLIPISIAKENKVEFTGRGNLGKRPLDLYYEIFENQEIKYSKEEGKLDLKINGKLKGGEFKIRGDISSQFITGLLFTLPLLKEDSKIILTTKLESKGYIDLTIDVMKKFGIVIYNKDYKEFIVKGNQEYKQCDYTVEGDYSQAAFFLCADGLKNDIEIEGLSLNSYQGDKAILDILKKLGAEIKVKGNKIQVSAEKLKGAVIDGSQCPDIIPAISVVCALSEGTSRIINSERLRIKECDRLNAMCTELNKLGADVKETEDGLIINGVKEFKGAHLFSHKDHRIAMSLAVAATCTKGDVTIDYSDCVKKSYPDFWHDYKALGGNVHERILGE